MLRNRFREIEKDFDGSLEYDTPRAKYAYYRIGGKAEVIATPRSFQDLSRLHAILIETGVPFFILGWGSNILFSDADYPGVILRMKHLFTEIEELSELNGISGNFLKLGASLGASSLLKKAGERGYGGLACVTGVPGSVGGMVTMNAGTHLGELGSMLIQTETVNLNEAGMLTPKIHVHDEHDFSYRENHFLKFGDLITHAYLEYERRDPLLVQSEIEELYQRRKATQPINLPSCGSVFMNPKSHGMNAWQVIDQLGLRGHRIGQAQISEKHSNFIVNLGSARAVDVKALIDLVKARALNELGITLQEEVKYIL
jgi:UDP-N-acetylmuramate dehydrogenase